VLLGSNHTRQQYESEEVLVALLLTQNRYAEAYLLLQNESPNEPSTQYNMALCHYYACDYQQAIVNLDKAQSVFPVVKGLTNNHTDQFYYNMRQQQNQQDDHLHAITKKYIANFHVLTREAIVRLKTDCWLHLGEYAKVIELATPVEHKNYKNIAEALKIAKNHISNEQ
jgi:tetratricopeptide (TPR) repeat protein